MTTKKLYTHPTKGGEYEVVGTSSGAGRLKACPLIIYRDTTTGQMFHREPEEFAMRMQTIGSIDSEALIMKLEKLQTAMDEISEFIADNPHDMGVAEYVIGKIAAVKGVV